MFSADRPDQTRAVGARFGDPVNEGIGDHGLVFHCRRIKTASDDQRITSKAQRTVYVHDREEWISPPPNRGVFQGFVTGCAHFPGQVAWLPQELGALLAVVIDVPDMEDVVFLQKLVDALGAAEMQSSVTRVMIRMGFKLF